jgi:hypothetical protein
MRLGEFEEIRRQQVGGAPPGATSSWCALRTYFEPAGPAGGFTVLIVTKGPAQAGLFVCRPGAVTTQQKCFACVER